MSIHSSWSPVVTGLLPAILLIAFGTVLGTFPGAAMSRPAVAGHLVLLCIVLSVIGSWMREAGDLPPRRVIVALLAGTALIAGSSWLSPVPRAGWTALALLPAWFAVPGWIRRCWSDDTSRLWGIRGCAGVVIVISGWSLWARGAAWSQPVAMPLGHHNLLAAFLIPLLPLLWALRTGGGLNLGLGLLAGVSGMWTLIETGSLAGVLALGVMSVIGVIYTRSVDVRKKSRRASVRAWLVGGIGGLTLLGSQFDRFRQIAAGSDLSIRARWTYLEAGWAGFMERPWWGWGPGAAHWTVAEHLRPIPGVHPPGQLVADLHCLPLQLLYELGLAGTVGAALLVWAWWRTAAGSRQTTERGSDQRQLYRRCATVGLVGTSVFAATGFALDVPALPMALMPCLALLLPGEQQRRHVEAAAGSARRLWGMASWIVVGAIVLWQLPRDRAHLIYERAIEAPPAEAVEQLQQARALDPRFPLYAWRLALIRPNGEAALAAAESGRGLAALWLTAGEQHSSSGVKLRAWTAAMRFDPQSAVAPFRLAFDSGVEGQTAKRWAEQALMAEPLLVAAVVSAEREPLLRRAAESLSRRPDLDVYWRARILDLVMKRSDGGETRALGLKADAIASESISLYAFRRAPWPVVVTRIELEAQLLPQIDLVPVRPSPSESLPETHQGALGAP